jgi:hypothetical protein
MTAAKSSYFFRIASMSAIERVQQLSRNLYFHQTVPLFSDGA